MSKQEKGLRIDRRTFFQLSTVRGADKLAPLVEAGEKAAKVVGWVAQHPDQAMAIVENIAEAGVRVLDSFTSSYVAMEPVKAPNIAEISPKTRALNVVSSMFNSYAESLRKLGLDPSAVIEPIADHLAVASSLDVFHGSFVIANPDASLSQFTLIDDPFQGGSSSTKEMLNLMDSIGRLYKSSPLVTHFVFHANGRDPIGKQFFDLKKYRTINRLYLGDLLPVT